jgi:3-phosphoshikimate 1-carboxyvinyltransferase
LPFGESEVKLIVERSTLKGRALIPASKSHTIRACIIGMLAEGTSVAVNPLDSLDTKAGAKAARALGADVKIEPGRWTIRGTGGKVVAPSATIDTENSGTTLYFAMAAAALADRTVTLTGDASIRTRPAGPLIQCLNDLGAEARSTLGNGCAPITVRGPLKGGKTKLAAVTSQYLSSLLIACPLAKGDTEIELTQLNEAPYVRMTLDWLKRQGIRVETRDLMRFHIPGGQKYRAFERHIPGDFSSATFFLVAGAVVDSDITLDGLDMSDEQGDKAVVDFVRAMGAKVTVSAGGIRVARGKLAGGEFDLNATPDALPAMSVAAALADGETRIVNVAQARVKETDRIAVMREELSKMGADISERTDGLVIRGGNLRGAEVEGHDDHRVVMALAVAGLAAEGKTIIHGAECAAVTFPNFVSLMTSLGARVSLT